MSTYSVIAESSSIEELATTEATPGPSPYTNESFLAVQSGRQLQKRCLKTQIQEDQNSRRTRNWQLDTFTFEIKENGAGIMLIW